jgi:hypothetical protein
MNPTVTVVSGPHEGDTYEWNGEWTTVSEADSLTGKMYNYNVSSFTLYEGDTIEISGLPVGAQYEVTETSLDGNHWLQTDSSNTTGTITEEGSTASITNLYLHDSIVPTGIERTKKTLMILFCGLSVIFVLILRRLREQRYRYKQ